jgi:hypothetical protein
VGTKEMKRGGGLVSYHWKIINQNQQLVAQGTNT